MTKDKTKERQVIKGITARIKNGDTTAVQTKFTGGYFTVSEFTSMFMAILETYTELLLNTNGREAVFEHFNRVFGIFLNKVLPDQNARYKLSQEQKDFKDLVHNVMPTLDEMTEDERIELNKTNQENRMAAAILAREILVNDAGLTEESADLLLNKKLGLIDPIA